MKCENLKRESWRVAKFGFVGMLNTLVSAAVYAALRWAGTGIDVSYVVSYAAGIANSYAWNRTLVFHSSDTRRLRQALLFAAGALGCMAVQWACLRGLMLFGLPEAVAYAVSLVVSPVLNYVFNRLVVFREAR